MTTTAASISGWRRSDPPLSGLNKGTGADPPMRLSLFPELLADDDYRSLHQRLAPV